MISRVSANAPAITSSILVATKNLDLGSVIGDADLRVSAWTGTVPEGAIAKIADAVGRGITAPIYANEPVTASRLGVKGAGGGLAATIPPGMRAVAIRVNEIVGVAGFVVAGTHVDVLVSGNSDGSSGTSGSSATRTLLQNISVLSAGQDFKKDTEGKPITVQVVNLLVTPEQAEMLSLAGGQMTVQLVLRNPLDTAVAVIPAVSLSSIFPGQLIPAVRSPQVIAAKPAPVPLVCSGSATSLYSPHGDHRRQHPDRNPVTKSGGPLMRELDRYTAIPLAACLLCPGTFAQKAPDDRALSVMVGKALIIDSDADILRVAVAGATLAETVAINPREILVNGLLPGETSLVMWEAGGARLVYDLTVRPSSAKLDAVRQQLAAEVGSENVTLDFENDTAFLRGTVRDMVTATRAVSIAASTMGKVVNLLYVDVPPVESAGAAEGTVFERRTDSRSRQLGLNLLSTTGQLAGTATAAGQFSLGDVINLLLFRKDFNLSTVLTALRSRQPGGEFCPNRMCWRSMASKRAFWPAANSRIQPHKAGRSPVQ